ncbi:hypothetical protein ONE63_011177 [Megalurothrips usitatus]|uniref:Uncharacterized protein n=1 Tax=Megalurothrips usitatus TaxID=439358 RepID=A0AAV7X451_9NEOP|nr:hypothetical protein ONE63_011177 [Megalurothrips usitatus]
MQTPATYGVLDNYPAAIETLEEIGGAVDGFKPASAEDIPNREYLVPRQDSFDDSLSGEHIDGRFSARILLVGASPEGIEAKAKALKIRLPSNWPSPSNETKT